MDFGTAKGSLSKISELQRKTFVTVIASWLTVPYALAWLLSTYARENLAVSMSFAYLIVLGVIVYCSLRTIAAFKANKNLPTFNFIFCFFDLLIISFVISITGGQQSVFFNLFWATVISATIFLVFQVQLAHQ